MTSGPDADTIKVWLMGDETPAKEIPKKKIKDGVISVKTFQSQFPSGEYQPEQIMPHTARRIWGQIFNNGTIGTTSNPVPSQPAVPASTVAQQNVNAYPVQVVISGGAATVTTVNGIVVGSGDGTFIIPAYGAIAVTYSVAPTWVWSNANSAPTGNANIYVCSSIGDAMASTPIGLLLTPGEHIDIPAGTTELYLVANGAGIAPTVSVVTVNEQI